MNLEISITLAFAINVIMVVITLGPSRIVDQVRKLPSAFVSFATPTKMTPGDS